MRRWVIAIFSLHFLASLHLFTWGHIGVKDPGPLKVASSAKDADFDPQQARYLYWLDHASDHGLTDEKPELPDQMALAVSLPPAGHTLPRPHFSWLDVIPAPDVDRLRRPPRV